MAIFALILLLATLLVAFISMVILTIKKDGVLRIDEIANGYFLVSFIGASIANVIIFGDKIADLVFNSPGEDPFYGIFGIAIGYTGIVGFTFVAMFTLCCIVALITSIIMDIVKKHKK